MLLAGVVEPAWEYFVGNASFDWAFGAARTLALTTFVITGVVTYLAVLALARRDKASRSTS